MSYNTFCCAFFCPSNELSFNSFRVGYVLVVNINLCFPLFLQSQGSKYKKERKKRDFLRFRNGGNFRRTFLCCGKFSAFTADSAFWVIGSVYSTNNILSYFIALPAKNFLIWRHLWGTPTPPRIIKCHYWLTPTPPKLDDVILEQRLSETSNGFYSKI
jgi:hypothetical protein